MEHGLVKIKLSIRKLIAHFISTSFLPKFVFDMMIISDDLETVNDKGWRTEYDFIVGKLLLDNS